MRVAQRASGRFPPGPWLCCGNGRFARLFRHPYTVFRVVSGIRCQESNPDDCRAPSRPPRRRRPRQCDRRRDRRGRRARARPPRSGQGHDDADRAGAHERAVRGASGRRSRCPAGPAPTRWPRSRRLAPAPPTSARSRTTSSAKCSATTSGRPGSTFRHLAAARRPADRALPGAGHAGRAADHGDLPRRLRRARARTTSTRPRSAAARSSISRAICGTGRRPRPPA